MVPKPLRHKFTTNATLSHLALIYGLEQRLCAFVAPSQHRVASVFEAYLGAAFLDASERNELGAFLRWTTELFSP
jgi:dsRNA-specific ribonuclease